MKWLMVAFGSHPHNKCDLGQVVMGGVEKEKKDKKKKNRGFVTL